MVDAREQQLQFATGMKIAILISSRVSAMDILLFSVEPVQAI